MHAQMTALDPKQTWRPAANSIASSARPSGENGTVRLMALAGIAT